MSEILFHLPQPPSDDALDCLVEIYALAMDRMNSGPVSGGEAFTLGRITGTAMRVPLVAERVRELDEREARHE